MLNNTSALAIEQKVKVLFFPHCKQSQKAQEAHRMGFSSSLGSPKSSPDRLSPDISVVGHDRPMDLTDMTGVRRVRLATAKHRHSKVLVLKYLLVVSLGIILHFIAFFGPVFNVSRLRSTAGHALGRPVDGYNLVR